MAAEVIVFPDAEQAVIETIDAGLTARAVTATVATRVPNPVPDRLVVVRRLGGVARNLVVDDAQISVECWGPDADETAAHDLAQLCRGLVHAMQFDGAAYQVQEFAGPALLPDPDSDRPRYVFTVLVALRGAAT